mgnify:CR=1 FL=1
MWVYPLNLIGGILSVILFTLGAFDSSMYGKAVYPSSFEYGTRQKPGSPIPSKFWTLEGERIDQPKPIITTDGPLGTPGSFRLPEAYVVSGETNSLQISKVGQTPSSKISIAAMRSKWGIDDNPSFAYNHSPHSIWVAAAGNQKRDSEFDDYPPNMDTWIKTKNPLDLRAVQMASVEFYMYYRTEVQSDWIFVGASVDGVNFIGEYWTGWSRDFQYFNLNLSEFK